MLLRANKWGMQYFSEHTNGGCYASQSIQTGDAILFRTKQTGDAILLRANKPGMLYFSEHTNGGCYASQNIQTGDPILLRTKQTGMLYF